MIYLNHVSFGYPGRQKLFENLSLKLEAGRIYGLLGKNGAGKSSLLRNITGLLYPRSGKVEVAGYTPSRREPAFLSEIFFVPEEIHFPSVNIERYLDLQAPFYPRFDEDLFRRLIQEFGIPHGNKLTAMSYGQKKKVLIAFALATNTKVLIMDEPTNGLDIPSKSQFRKIVASCFEPDRLILISTHQVRDLDSLIDSIVILEEGRIMISHSLEAVSEKLCFGTLPSVEFDDRVIYAEPSMRGYRAVFENSEREESKVDLEHLFNAVVERPDRIHQIFN